MKQQPVTLVQGYHRGHGKRPADQIKMLEFCGLLNQLKTQKEK